MGDAVLANFSLGTRHIWIVGLRLGLQVAAEKSLGASRPIGDRKPDDNRRIGSVCDEYLPAADLENGRLGAS
jgi:hypothetical protein